MSNTIRITKEIREMIEEFREIAIENSEKELKLAELEKKSKYYIAELKEEIEDKQRTCDSCMIKNALRYATIYFKEFNDFLNRKIEKTKI